MKEVKNYGGTKTFDVKVKENKKYNPAEFTIQVTCANADVAKNLTHREFGNIKMDKETIGWTYGDKIQVLDVKEVKSKKEGK